MEWPATATTAASGRNRELLLGQWPAGCKARSRADAAAGCHNPFFVSEEKATGLPVELVVNQKEHLDHDAGPHGRQRRTENQRAPDAGVPPLDPQRIAGGRRGAGGRVCGPLHCRRLSLSGRWCPRRGPAAGRMLPRCGQGRQTRQRPDRDRHRARSHLGGGHGGWRPVSGQPGHRHAQRDLQHQPVGRGPRSAAVSCGAHERGIRQRPAEGHGRAAGRGAVSAHGRFAGQRAAHHPQPLRQLCGSTGVPRRLHPLLRGAGGG